MCEDTEFIWLVDLIIAKLLVRPLNVSLTFHTFSLNKKQYQNYRHYLHSLHPYSSFSSMQVTKSAGFKTDLLIPLFPQDVHCYHNLFYMTTHISAAQMLPSLPSTPTPSLHPPLPPPHLPPPAASLHLWLLLQHPIH